MSEGTRQTGTKQDYGLECRHCSCKHFRVVYTRPYHGGRIMRRRMHVITMRCRGRWRRCVERISPKLHAYHAPAGSGPATDSVAGSPQLLEKKVVPVCRSSIIS